MPRDHRDLRPIGGQPNAGVHVVHDYTFESSAAMTALSDSIRGVLTLAATDVGRVARVGSAAPYDFYILTDHAAPTWEQINGGGGGSGDVTGPESSTANAVARYSDTTGEVIKSSAVTIDDSGNIATTGTVDGRDVSADGTALDGHIAATSGAHPASAISYDPGDGPLVATTAQGAIDEIAEFVTGPVTDAIDAAVLTTDPRLSDARTPTAHASTHVPGSSDAIGPAAPLTETGTTRVLAATDHGRTILYTHASGCEITVPHTLSPGHTVEHVALGGAVVTVVGSGGLTVRQSPGCDAEIIDGGTAYTRVESATSAALVGELVESA